jgi:hypothetical protein
MTHFVTMNEAAGYVRVVTHGTFDEPGYRAMVDDILSRTFWEPGMAVLFDHRGLSFEGAGFDLMQRTSTYHLQHNDRIGDGKAAVVVAERAAFGSARQFEALLHDRANARMRVFYDLDKAISWLTG